MIRERRNKEKLLSYYNKFIKEGVVDPNVHPWVAESWQRCKSRHLDNEKISLISQLSSGEIQERKENNKIALNFMSGLHEESHDILNRYNISMILIDEDGYVLENFSQIAYEKNFLSDIVGKRISERDIGTTSISIAKEHKTPFLLFGVEAWIKQLHLGDSFAAPVYVNDRLRYMIAFFSMDRGDIPYGFIMSMLQNFKYTLQEYIALSEKHRAITLLLDEMPVSVFSVRPGGKTTYVNKAGLDRLEGNKNLNEVFVNYEHIPINKAFQGTPSYNKEVVWLAKDKTFEDITTVLPVKTGDDITSVIAASFSVEDLKTIIAHATGYTSRYSLGSMVGKTQGFTSLQNKANRVAKTSNNVLLQGEPGTGKQRLAHGLHQASARAANSLIVVKCGKVTENVLFTEIFGYGEESTGWVPGKLELANMGTLFIDEIEKLSVSLGNKIADALSTKSIVVGGEKKAIDVRLIAACDSNLKRLAAKGLFSNELYKILSKTVIRVPPLRERVEDIAILSDHILSEIAQQHNIAPKKLSPEALELLQKCSWAGNIKQLQGVLEMAFFHKPGFNINADNIKLPNDIVVGKAWKYEKEAFVEAWKASGGNVSRLSIMFDVSRVTLYRYLKKYGLSKE